MEQEQPQVKTEAPVDTNEPVFHDDNKKSSPTGLIIGLVLLALIAAGGVGFGVWQMMQGSSKDKQIADLKTQVTNCANANSGSYTEATTVTCPDGTEVEVETVSAIDNVTAQTIVNPYLKHFSTFTNLLDYEFNDGAKIKVAFKNMDSGNVYGFESGSPWTVKVSYSGLNDEYKYLFGSELDLEKREYAMPDLDRAVYLDEGAGLFEFTIGGLGGTGATMFSIVKDAQYSDNKLIINVYHGKAPWCQETTDDSCIVPYSLANSEAVSEYIKKNSVPVYAMTFVKDSGHYADNGHYVLSNVQKQ